MAPGGGGGKGPRVDATEPPGAPQNITLDVRVFGSGFDNGSKAVFTIDGNPQPEVVTNLTTYVSSGELVANLTLDLNATIELYDVEVTTFRGKKGIGADLFQVVPEGTSVGPLDLGTMSGDDAQALDANTVGQVVGRDHPDLGPTRGFLWTESSGMIDIGTLGGPSGDAIGINDAGQVTGGAQTASGETHAFVWTQSGGMTDLGTLLEGDYSYGTDINQLGWVAGVSKTGALMPDGSPAQHCFLWTPSGGMQDLGSLAPGTNYDHCQTEGINNNGDVVGSSYTASGELHAILWTQAGGMRDLGTLGGTYSQAIDVNDGGQVVGGSRKAGSAANDHLAFLWTEAGGMVEIGTLGGSRSFATAINNAGVIAGQSRLPDRSKNKSGDTHAFLWTPTDGMVDLGTLPHGTWSQTWGMSEAIGGDVVWITGWADNPQRAFYHNAVLWKLDLTALPAPPDDGGDEGGGGPPPGKGKK